VFCFVVLAGTHSTLGSGVEFWPMAILGILTEKNWGMTGTSLSIMYLEWLWRIWAHSNPQKDTKVTSSQIMIHHCFSLFGVSIPLGWGQQITATKLSHRSWAQTNGDEPRKRLADRIGKNGACSAKKTLYKLRSTVTLVNLLFLDNLHLKKYCISYKKLGDWDVSMVSNQCHLQQQIHLSKSSILSHWNIQAHLNRGGWFRYVPFLGMSKCSKWLIPKQIGLGDGFDTAISILWVHQTGVKTWNPIFGWINLIKITSHSDFGTLFSMVKSSFSMVKPPFSMGRAIPH